MEQKKTPIKINAYGFSFIINKYRHKNPKKRVFYM